MRPEIVKKTNTWNAGFKMGKFDGKRGFITFAAVGREYENGYEAGQKAAKWEKSGRSN